MGSENVRATHLEASPENDFEVEAAAEGKDESVLWPLVGFFVGVAMAVFVPMAYGTLTWPPRTLGFEGWMVWGTAILLLPAAMYFFERLRRPAFYMVLGIVLTVFVIGGTALATFFVLTRWG